MNWKAVLILILLLLAVIFTAQNHEVVKIKFLFWSFEASRAIILFLTMVIGIIIGLAVSFIARKE